MAERLKSIVPLLTNYEGQDVVGWYMSEKYDGMRAIWLAKKKVLLSRYGKQIHAPKWWLDMLPGMDLDGELWAGRGEFQKVMSICRARVSERDWSQIEYKVFDHMDDGDLVFHQRLQKLAKVVENEVVKKVEHTEIQRGLDLDLKMREITDAGGEGLVFRYPYSVWVPKRTKHILRRKIEEIDYAVVVSVNQGQGRHRGRMGSLTVSWGEKEFDIGTGFTDAEREQQWLLGEVIEFRYRELTKGGVPKEAGFKRRLTG